MRLWLLLYIAGHATARRRSRGLRSAQPPVPACPVKCRRFRDAETSKHTPIVCLRAESGECGRAAGCDARLCTQRLGECWPAANRTAATAPHQRIPRTIRQTHNASLANLPPGMRAATHTWRALNPEYEYCWFDDAAVRAYVRAHGGAFDGFREAFAAAPSGAMRCDMWRALVTFREGGVYADADTVLRRALREVLRPADDAVSGVGHEAHGLEQFILAYSARHPVMRALIDGMLVEIAARGGAARVRGWAVMSATGPLLLQRVTAELLLNGSARTPQFDDRGGVFPVRGHSGRSVRVLAGRYSCPREGRRKVYYCDDVNRFGGNADFKYRGYEEEQAMIGKSYHDRRRAMASPTPRRRPRRYLEP